MGILENAGVEVGVGDRVALRVDITRKDTHVETNVTDVMTIRHGTEAVVRGVFGDRLLVSKIDTGEYFTVRALDVINIT